MRSTISICAASVLLSACVTQDLPYESNGTMGYERFSVPVKIVYSQTQIRSETIAQIGDTVVFETPIEFMIVSEAQQETKVMTSRGDLFGVIEQGQKFVGMQAVVSKINWGALMLGAGLFDNTYDTGTEDVACTRLLLRADGDEASESNDFQTRFACFSDADGDGTFDSAHAPFRTSTKESGYLPSFFMKPVSASFEPFELSRTDSGALSGELHLVGSTHREKESTWLGDRIDKVYRFQGSLSPQPLGLGQESIRMSDYLPTTGKEFANKIEWMGGFVVLKRESEEDDWSISVLYPNEDLESDLKLVFDVGRVGSL